MSGGRASGPALEAVAALMATLRDPVGGCPWDLEQTFETIVRYTIEEAYEVADAVARRDMEALRDELGDLLLQVLFHSRMAEEAGAFTLVDVIDALGAKLVRRHPHVFGNGSAEAPVDVSASWEAIKARERRQASAVAGVALALPALMRAEKLQKRAARVGFDWPDAAGPLAKIHEELGEIEAAETQQEFDHEVGDLLFAAVNYARHLGVDAEAALRSASARFEARFRAMEARAGGRFAELPLAEKDRLWEQVKAAQSATGDPGESSL